MEIRRVRFEIIDEMLGTNPGVKEIHEEFIASQAPDAETRQQELEHMPTEEVVSKEMTVFYRNPETNAIEIPNHWFYGFCKSSCGYLRRVEGTKSKKLTSYKKVIDGLIKAFPDAKNPRSRFIEVHLPDGGKIGNCQRPLRAQTMQGERVALANSETVPAGSWFELDIVCFDPKLWPTIEEWLDYGLYNGFGQWRSSGKGAFVWCYVDSSLNSSYTEFKELENNESKKAKNHSAGKVKVPGKDKKEVKAMAKRESKKDLVKKLAADGLSNKDIADQLGISMGTVSTYKSA